MIAFSPSHESQSVSSFVAVSFASATLSENGDDDGEIEDGDDVRKRLNELEDGDNPPTKVVDTEEELEELFEELVENGTKVNPSPPGICAYTLPDGTRIQLRDESNSGGKTIDVRYGKNDNQKVHIK